MRGKAMGNHRGGAGNLKADPSSLQKTTDVSQKKYAREDKIPIKEISHFGLYANIYRGLM